MQAVAAAIYHDDMALPVQPHRRWPPEPPLHIGRFLPGVPFRCRRFQVGHFPQRPLIGVGGKVVVRPKRVDGVAPQRSRQLPGGIENPHPFIAPIGHENAAAGAHRHPGRVFQPPRRFPAISITAGAGCRRPAISITAGAGRRRPAISITAGAGRRHPAISIPAGAGRRRPAISITAGAGSRRRCGSIGELAQVVAIRIQHLHPVVAPIGYIDAVIRVHRHAPGPGEFARPVPGLAAAQVAAGVAAGIAPRIIPRTSVAAARRMARRIADDLQQPPVGGEPLHPVVAAVGDEQIAAAVDGHAGGTVELAGSVARLAPIAQQPAIGAENRDAVQGLIGDIEAVIRVAGDAAGPPELAGRRPAAAEFAQVFLPDGAAGNALVGQAHRNFRPGAVQHIQHALRVDGGVHRVLKPAPQVGKHPDSMAVFNGGHNHLSSRAAGRPPSSGNQPVIFSMRAYPMPNDNPVIHPADRPVLGVDSDGIVGVGGLQFAKAQTWMPGVFLKQPVCLLGPLLNFVR